MREMMIAIYSHLGRFTLLLALIFCIAYLIDADFLSEGFKDLGLTIAKVLLAISLSLVFAGCVLTFFL